MPCGSSRSALIAARVQRFDARKVRYRTFARSRADGPEPVSPPDDKPPQPLKWSCFDEVLAVELHSINRRRAALSKTAHAEIATLPADTDATPYPPVRMLSPNHAKWAPKDLPFSTSCAMQSLSNCRGRRGQITSALRA